MDVQQRVDAIPPTTLGDSVASRFDSLRKCVNDRVENIRKQLE